LIIVACTTVGTEQKAQQVDSWQRIQAQLFDYWQRRKSAAVQVDCWQEVQQVDTCTGGTWRSGFFGFHLKNRWRNN